MRKLVKSILGSVGLEIKKIKKPVPFDMEESFVEIYEKCKEYSLCSVERMYSLYKSVEYICENNIQGSFVECGVWRGGSCMMIAETLKKFEQTNRKIYLFDTFEGMVEPGELDVEMSIGVSAKESMSKVSKVENDPSNIWAYASLNEVKRNMKKTTYPEENIEYIVGKVEDTLPQTTIKDIALLRLDTDWYESTRVEMEQLYPELNSKGILIIDDYGHFKGARQAVDEYFEKNNKKVFMSRVDNTARLIVKSEN
tara:strand:- start:130187 stop:130948 length:762 start_codon:yes stop_codon:yes gene_type:complete